MLIRTQDKVPEIYVNDSRDFQVLCRAYDFIFNMIKFDADSIVDILSASTIRDNMILLLQTKLGFFTPKNLDDISLRYVLGAFASIIKNKGSLTAIQQAINVWLKSEHLEIDMRVDIFNEDGGYVGDGYINPYTVAIGSDGFSGDYTVLEEMLKYVIPAGYELYFYTYSSLRYEETLPMKEQLHESAIALEVSNNINSIVRNPQNNAEDYDGQSISDVEEKLPASIFTTVRTTETISATDDTTPILGAIEDSFTPPPM